MATKEEIDDIRTTIERGWYAGNIGDARTLLSALDDANKRIAQAEEDTRTASQCAQLQNRIAHDQCLRIEELGAKLAKVREWAEAQYETQATVRDDCGNEVLAILDGKDTP